MFSLKLNISGQQFYLEYNSTIKCSLMFSEIWSRAGTLMYFPVKVALSNSSQELFVERERTVFTIVSRDFERSLTAIISPGFNVYEEMFTTFPFTVICL